MNFASSAGLFGEMTAKGGPPGTIVLVLSGPIAPTDVTGVCERARVLLEGSDGDLVVCDVGALADPDAVTVDVVARLQLTAGRLGRQVRLRHACRELQELLVLTGIDEVLSLEGRVRPRAEGASRRAGTGSRCRGRS